jgi:hypothetical protein
VDHREPARVLGGVFMAVNGEYTFECSVCHKDFEIIWICPRCRSYICIRCSNWNYLGIKLGEGCPVCKEKKWIVEKNASK